MKRKTRRWHFPFLAILALNALAGAAPLHAEKCQLPDSIRFSMVPFGDVEKDLRRYQPLFKRIEELSGRKVAIVRPSSYASVVEGLLGGSIDIAELGPATYVAAKRGDASITAFATTEKRGGVFQSGGSYYRAMLVVLASSAYHDIAELRGSRLALTDPGSTSGSLLPRKRFAALLGTPLENHFAAISFSGSHSKSVLALARGDVDAAFISSAQLDAAEISGKLPASRVRVLWTSEAIPYDPFVYRGQLCDALRRQIRSAFLGDAATASLRDLLEGFNATRFSAVDDDYYAGIRSLLGSPAK